VRRRRCSNLSSTHSCWADGKSSRFRGVDSQIGAPALARTPVTKRYERELRNAVIAYARHSYSADVVLVPGVPERSGALNAVDWLQAFKLRVDWAMAEIQHGRNSRKASTARAALLRAEQVCLDQAEVA